jgi:hypothetical protein
MTEEEFERKVHQDCAYRGVAVYVEHDRYINDEDGDANGWFDYTIPKLAYAKGHDKWFPVLLHEYNHMQQWIDKDPLLMGDQQVEADEYLWDWLAKDIELTAKKSREYILSTLLMELDCDRRSHKMITELDLPLDPDYYAQTANAYVLFYHLVLKHRKWYEIDEEPYHIDEIVSEMPTDLYTLDYRKISDEMVTLFETHMPAFLD